MQELDTDVPHFTGAQLGQRAENIRHQGTKGLVLRSSGNKDDEGYSEIPGVLLMAEARVSRDESVELAGRRSEEGTIVQRGLPHFRDRSNFVARQVSTESMGHALVKQNSHGPRSIPWPARGPRSRAHE